MNGSSFPMYRFVFMGILALSGTGGGKAAEPKVPANKLEEPQLRFAEFAKEAVTAKEKELSQIEEEIVKAIESVELDRLDQAKLAAGALRQFIGQLRKMAKDLLDKREAYFASNRSLKTTLEKSVPAFGEASKLFRQYAAEETQFDDIRRDYESLATAWDELGAVMTKRASGLDAEVEEIKKAMVYVERTELFLSRLEASWSVYENLEPDTDRQKFLDQLRKYAEGFEGLRRHLNGFNDKLKSEALAPELRRADTVAGAPWKIKPSHGFLGTLKATPEDSLKPGDEFTLYRKDKAIGKVEVQQSLGRGYHVVFNLMKEPFRDGDAIRRPAKVVASANPTLR